MIQAEAIASHKRHINDFSLHSSLRHHPRAFGTSPLRLAANSLPYKPATILARQIFIIHTSQADDRRPLARVSSLMLNFASLSMEEEGFS
jgi:hypothetical protein